MAVVLDELALAPELAAPLRGTSASGDRLAGLLGLVRSWEAGDWEGVRTITSELGISPADVGQAYIDSVHWADCIACESAAP